MNTFEAIQTGIEAGRAKAEAECRVPFRITAVLNQDKAGDEPSQLCKGDNIEYMKWLLSSGYKGRIKMIYIDPPFFTREKYDATITIQTSNGKEKYHHIAYDDGSRDGLENYIEDMTARLILMRELMTDDGLIWVHLDWHSVHYIRLVLDEVFGADHFVNDIIWMYKSGGSGRKHFAKKHDDILVYSKSDDYYIDIPKEKSYNRGLRPYHFKGVKEYQDDVGWYTLVNMKDVWPIDMVGRTSKERNGYATQKPVELLKRIVLTSSRKGDICADFFCGSGALADAAESSGRKWICCDSEKLATALTRKRLYDMGAGFKYIEGENRERPDDELFPEEEKGGLFVPDINYSRVPLKEWKPLKRAAAEEPESLIMYMITGTISDGVLYVSTLITDNYDQVTIDSYEKPSFIIVDVFGEEYALR